jgi:hypothetical protein
MNCPYCNANNDPANQYCLVCGRPLSIVNAQSSSRNMLWIISGRFFFALLFLFLMRAILNGLAFVENMVIPEINLRTTVVINVVVFITVIVLLINYLTAFSHLWPQAFPRYHEAAVIVTTILYLIALNQLYLGISQLMPLITTDAEVMMIIAVALVIIAIIMVIRAFVITYNALPNWLSTIQFNAPPVPPALTQPTQENPASRN